MKNSEEGCVLQEQQKKLADKVENIDSRLTKVEADVGKMRTETQDGFRQGAEAMHDAVVGWCEAQRDKALLPSTKAIWQAIIDKLEEQ